MKILVLIYILESKNFAKSFNEKNKINIEKNGSENKAKIDKIKKDQVWNYAITDSSKNYDVSFINA